MQALVWRFNCCGVDKEDNHSVCDSLECLRMMMMMVKSLLLSLMLLLMKQKAYGFILKQINAISVSIYCDNFEGHDVSQKTSVFWDVMLSGLIANWLLAETSSLRVKNKWVRFPRNVGNNVLNYTPSDPSRHDSSQSRPLNPQILTALSSVSWQRSDWHMALVPILHTSRSYRVSCTKLVSVCLSATRNVSIFRLVQVLYVIHASFLLESFVCMCMRAVRFPVQAYVSFVDDNLINFLSRQWQRLCNLSSL